MTKNRINSKWWRHDGYTLRRLQKALENAIASMARADILHPNRSVVIDYGAGEVPYREIFSNYCHEYIACDLVQSPGIDVIFGKDGKLPFSNGRADCVLSVQVLEHVWDLDTYLAECHRCLSPTGHLLLSTHGTWLYHPHPTDYRRWTRDGLCRELEERGFEVVNIQAVIGPLAWTTQFRALAYHNLLNQFFWPGKTIALAVNLVMCLRMIIEDALTPKKIYDSNAAIYVVTARVRK